MLAVLLAHARGMVEVAGMKAGTVAAAAGRVVEAAQALVERLASRVEMVGTVATGRGGRPLHANAANGTDLDAADQHHSDLAVRTTTRSPQISGLMGVLWAHVLYLIHI